MTITVRIVCVTKPIDPAFKALIDSLESLRPERWTPPLQVIIFSFSKKECEALALQMSALELNDEAETKLVDGIFGNAVECLSEDDRRLPQIQHLLPMLRRGIGIHHSGLLPILKEVIEILFQEGLLKVHSTPW